MQSQAKQPASPIDVSQSDVEHSVKTARGRVLLDWLAFLARAMACCVCLQAAFTVLSSLHPVLELAAHCSMHALCLGLILLPTVYFLRDKGLATVLGCALIYLLSVTQPWGLIPSQHVAAEPNETSIKVLSWNLLVTNRSLAEIESVIMESKPDVLVLIEVRPGIIEDLPFLEREFQHVLQQPSWGGEGIAILSRIPETSIEIEDFDYEYQPGLVARISSGNKNVVLAGIHTLSPVPLFRAAVRDRQIDAVCAWSDEQNIPICVCGDFNTTPWTRPFNKLLESGFVDSRVNSGNSPSWPTSLGVLGIPIDHSITKGKCRVVNRRVIRTEMGSDHFPIEFELIF